MEQMTEVVEVVRYSKMMSMVIEFRSMRNHAIHHLCRIESRYHSASQKVGLTEPRVISKDASGHGASDLSPSRNL